MGMDAHWWSALSFVQAVICWKRFHEVVHFCSTSTPVTRACFSLSCSITVASSTVLTIEVPVVERHCCLGRLCYWVLCGEGLHLFCGFCACFRLFNHELRICRALACMDAQPRGGKQFYHAGIWDVTRVVDVMLTQGENEIAIS